MIMLNIALYWWRHEQTQQWNNLATEQNVYGDLVYEKVKFLANEVKMDYLIKAIGKQTNSWKTARVK